MVFWLYTSPMPTWTLCRLSGHWLTIFTWSGLLIVDAGDGHYTSASTWVLLARYPAMLTIPAIAAHTKPMAGYAPAVRLWTDNYSNLFQLLKH